MFSSLLDHDPEILSSSFTFGRTRASSVLLSLHHDLASVVDIDAALRRLAAELATVQRVPSLTPSPSPKGEGSSYTCCLIVAKVELEGADAGDALSPALMLLSRNRVGIIEISCC